MTTTTEITTERLVLKSVTPAFIIDCFESKTEQEIKSIFGSDDKDFETLKMSFEKGIETYRISLFYFLLIDADSRKTIGECGFHTWNIVHQRAEVFYNMKDGSFKNKGLMKEALPVVLDYGFNELNLHRVQALIDMNNEPSLRLLQRFGFNRECTMREDYLVDGVFEDSECFSLLKWEWQKRN